MNGSAFFIILLALLAMCFRWGNAFAYYGIVLMTTELFEAGDSCHGGDGSTMAEPPCWLQCKLLTTKDYIDLLWTTISEFPGMSKVACYISEINN